MYAPARSKKEQEALSEFGFSESDFGAAVEIWPDNLTAFNFFCSLQTQWRTGAGGPSGLDYGVMFHMMDRMGLAALDYEQLQADIQVLEAAALGTINTKD